ncbi:hypothetical protein [Nocardia sp. NPDC051570]|uniref:hypothetical protein n=1 Tax=Nocardia sp. NPDC051570 TaxID=3364324 RepID=UPI00379178CD
MAAALGLIPACSSNTDHPNQPGHNEMSFRWVAGPGADLSSSDATFVRAFIESQTRYMASGDNSSLYPGFTEANSAVKLSTVTTAWRRTQLMGLAEITTLPDGTGRATVCEWWNKPSSPGFAYLYYTRQGSFPLPDQRGPSVRPNRNVFGHWTATKENNTVELGDDYQKVATACQALTPPIGDFPSSDATVQPPVPGWPS